MKKIYKSVLAFALALVLLLSLSGCSALDNMRSQQVYDTGHGTVIWNEQTYKALPLCEYLSPAMDYSTSLYVTEEDVPVLLSTTIYQERLDVSADEDFLVGYSYGTVVYCKEELYDELYQRINAPFVPDMVCYEYSIYNEDTAQFEDRCYQLKQEQLSVIEQIISQSEPTATGEDIWKYSDINWELSLYESSQDQLFQKDYVEIWSQSNGYSLLVHADEMQLYSIPVAYESVIHEIVAEYKTNNGFNMDYEVMATVPYYAG